MIKISLLEKYQKALTEYDLSLYSACLHLSIINHLVHGFVLLWRAELKPEEKETKFDTKEKTHRLVVGIYMYIDSQSLTSIILLYIHTLMSSSVT